MMKSSHSLPRFAATFVLVCVLCHCQTGAQTMAEEFSDSKPSIAMRTSSTNVKDVPSAGIPGEETLPGKTALLSFSLQQPQSVRLVVLDQHGREIRSLIREVCFDSGDHVFVLEGIGLEHGTYIYELRTSTQTIRRTITVD